MQCFRKFVKKYELSFFKFLFDWYSSHAFVSSSKYILYLFSKLLHADEKKFMNFSFLYISSPYCISRKFFTSDIIILRKLFRGIVIISLNALDNCSSNNISNFKINSFIFNKSF